jgi:anaerobic magnesium-protoporphyrin IX monomethyl ester cyclase
MKARKMSILLINVCLRPDSPLKLVPIGLAYIATAIKNAGFDFDLLDIDAERLTQEQIQAFIQKEDYDVVCMGCIVTGYKIVKYLAAEIRKLLPGTKIVAGNSVATSVVDTLLSHTEVDIAVMGEGDVTIVELLKALARNTDLGTVAGICFKKNSKVIQTPPRPLIKDLTSLPFINYSLFDIENYIRTSCHTLSDPLPFPREDARALPINTARGCVANCTFCYHVFKGNPYRYRKAQSLVAEISQMLEIYGLNYILLWDELTFFSKKQTKEFCECILSENLSFCWSGSCRGNLFNDEKDLQIMELMKKAGCVSIGYSLESADESILRDMNKHVSVEQFTKQTTLFRKAGVPVATSVVFGFPQETPETIRRTIDVCIKNGIYPSPGYLLPQPGSKIYDYAVENSYIQNEEEYLLAMGDRQDLRVNMTEMSDLEFEDHVLAGLSRCNEALGVGLEDDRLVKTTYYRAAKDATVQGKP